MRVLMLLIVGFLASATVAEAHVTVIPRESKAGATEKYTMRVPTEGKIATTSIEVQVPDGITIVSIDAADGVRFETKKSGDRIVTITWTAEIKPGESRQFPFAVVNPKDGSPVTWKIQQRYADGTSSDWTPVTSLTAP